MKERCNNVNELIEKISNRGRFFFRNEEKKNVARFIIKNGILSYEDEYKKSSGKITKKTKWTDLDWVNHGSTLKENIIDLAQFILTGNKARLFSRYWGYYFDELKEVHQLGFDLEILKSPDFLYYDYDLKKEVNSNVVVLAESTPEEKK